MRSPVAVSRLPVGSSANSTSGRVTKARGDGHALLLATGKLTRIVRRDGHPGRYCPGSRAQGSCFRIAGEFEGQHYVFQRGEGLQQMKGLKHEANPLRTQGGPSVFIQRGELGSTQPDLAPRRAIEPGEQGQQCRLAGA